MCLFLEKRPSFGITGTVNCLLACDHANGVLQVKKKHRERERESMRNGSFGLVFWLVRMEMGRLKALNSIGAQTLNPNSMPSFGNQTKTFS